MFGHRPTPLSVSPVDAPDEGARTNARAEFLIGWGLLATAAGTAYIAVAWSAPLPGWVPPVCVALALVWPGRHSPRAGLRACVRMCMPAPAGLRADVPAPAGAQVRTRRVSGRVWAALAGAGVAVLALVRVGGSLSVWVVLGGLILAGVGVIVNHFWGILPGAGMRRADSLTTLSSGGGAEGLAHWQAGTAGRWYDGVRSVPTLTLREDPEDVDEGQARQVLAQAEIVGEDVRAVPGGVAFAVDTSAAMKIARDVQEAIPRLWRVLDAEVVLVERVPARASFCVVTAYRGEPFHNRPPVDWRSLRRVPGGAEVVPVGETAHADLLGQDEPPPRRGPRPVLSGRQALMSYRGSTSISAAPDMGKSALVRAYQRGLLVQGVPFIPVLLDNKGDYWAQRAAAEAMGGMYVDNYAGFPAALDWAAGIGEGRYAVQGDRYQHVPTLAEPLVLVVIAEWLDFVEWCKTAKQPGALDTAGRIVRRHRGSAVNLVTTWQASQIESATKIRDWFPHSVALRVNKAAQVDMTLGDEALKHGAHAHLIPRSAQGVFYAVDRDTGSPYMGRAAWIPEEDQGAALVEPMMELGRRMQAAREAA